MKREVATFGVLAALLAIVVGAVPPFREAVVDTVRTAWDARFPAEWSGYYVRYDDPHADPAEGGGAQLYFASGSFPGRAVRVLSDGAVFGGWSATRERYAVGSGNRLYVADAHGSVSLLGNMRDLRPVSPISWVDDREIVFAASTGGPNRWVIRLDARSAALVDQRGLPEGYLALRASPEGSWLLALDQAGAGDGPAPIVAYDPVAVRTLRPGPGEAFQGWLSDGRLLVVAGAWPGPSQLVARSLDGGTDQLLLRADGSLRSAVAAGAHVAALEVGPGEGDPPKLWVIGPSGSAVRVGGSVSGTYGAVPSGDGRFVSFSVLLEGGKTRSGVIEAASGKVTYACESGCAGLALR